MTAPGRGTGDREGDARDDCDGCDGRRTASGNMSSLRHGPAPSLPRKRGYLENRWGDPLPNEVWRWKKYGNIARELDGVSASSVGVGSHEDTFENLLVTFNYMEKNKRRDLG